MQERLEHLMAWHAVRVVTARSPSIQRYHSLWVSKGIFNIQYQYPRCFPAPDTEKSHHKMTHRRHKPMAGGGPTLCCLC